jgi:hypothetical protein
MESWVTVDVSYAAPQAHGIVNVPLHREYSIGIVFIFSQQELLGYIKVTLIGVNEHTQ